MEKDRRLEPEVKGSLRYHTLNNRGYILDCYLIVGNGMNYGGEGGGEGAGRRELQGVVQEVGDILNFRANL